MPQANKKGANAPFFIIDMDCVYLLCAYLVETTRLP